MKRQSTTSTPRLIFVFFVARQIYALFGILFTGLQECVGVQQMTNMRYGWPMVIDHAQANLTRITLKVRIDNDDDAQSCDLRAKRCGLTLKHISSIMIIMMMMMRWWWWWPKSKAGRSKTRVANPCWDICWHPPCYCIALLLVVQSTSFLFNERLFVQCACFCAVHFC